MTSVVLTYKGKATGRQSADAKLRRLFPDAVVTPKTGAIVEVQLDESHIAALETQADWEVSRPTFAEIRKPAFNLKNIRAKLGRNG